MMSGLEMVRGAVGVAVAASEMEGSLGRRRAETARAVFGYVTSGEFPASDAELCALAERMNRASGNGDRSVAQAMIEVLVGWGIEKRATLS